MEKKKIINWIIAIMILLILAGVTIRIITKDNVVLRKEKESTNIYIDEEKEGTLGTAEGELNQSGNGEYVTGNTKVDVSDGSYYIPDGFKLAEDSGKTINEGIVVEDKNGNQWVWIPCYVDGVVGTIIPGAIKYDRYDFKVQDGSYSDYSETLDKNDEISIKAFGGYYIGRYEAGYGKSTNSNAQKSGTSSNGNTNVVTIKKGQEPYVGVTQTQSITLSKGIAETNNYDTSKMYTKLCSSYAWDTALKFIEKDYPTYPTNSTQGNHMDTIFTYTAINGETKKKDEKNLGSVPTGQTTAVKNIYDMGGNVWERTSEYCSDELYHCVSRGGGAYSYVAFNSAGDRGCISERSSNYDGFRITLYLN